MQLILIISCLAVSHALFWSIVLWTMNSRLSNRLLALLLVMIALRVGKSVFGILFTGHMLVFSSIGAVSMAEIGPFLFFFTRSFFDSTFKLKTRHYLQLLPGPLFLIPLLAFPEWPVLNVAYYLFTSLVAVYMFATAIYLYVNREVFRTDDLKWKWCIIVLSSLLAIWITFVCQINFYQPVVYLTIVVTAALVFYGLSLYAIPRSRMFLPDNDKKTSANPINAKLADELSRLLEDEQVFADTTLTVSKLASMVKVPPYLVSKTINQHFEKSFSEVVAGHRIRKARQLLENDSSKSMTIDAIAYESGFNTLSAFYQAFKKSVGVTPAQYRDSRRNSGMKIA